MVEATPKIFTFRVSVRARVRMTVRVMVGVRVRVKVTFHVYIAHFPLALALLHDRHWGWVGLGLGSRVSVRVALGLYNKADKTRQDKTRRQQDKTLKYATTLALGPVGCIDQRDARRGQKPHQPQKPKPKLFWAYFEGLHSVTSY
jgi:hypothetical protein